MKESRRILQQRALDDCLKSWANSGVSLADIVQINLSIFHATYEFLQWPNCYFFPSDRFCIIAGQIPGARYDSEDVLSEIAKYFPGDKVTILNDLYNIIESDQNLLSFVRWAQQMKMIPLANK